IARRGDRRELGRVDRLGVALEEGPRDRADLKALDERLAQRQGRVRVPGNGAVSGEWKLLEQRVHFLLAVARNDADRIAGLVVNVRALERELDVAYVLRGAASRQALIREHRCGKGILARVGVRDGGRAPVRSRRQLDVQPSLRRPERLLECAHYRIDPARGRRLEVHVALLAGVQALSAERLETGIELPTRLAVFLVARIPERKHRVAHMLEPRRLAAS